MIKDEFEKAWESWICPHDITKSPYPTEFESALWAAKWMAEKDAELLKTWHISKGGFGEIEHQIRERAKDLT